MRRLSTDAERRAPVRLGARLGHRARALTYRARALAFGARALALGAGALTLGACEENKPYTPFEVVSSLPEAPAPPATSEPSAAPTTQAPPPTAPARRALKAPRGATSWTVADQTLRAPEGHVFELALPLAPPAPHEPSPGVVVWTKRPGDEKSPTSGALWLYTDKASRRLTELPGFIPVGAGCEHTASLDQTGPGTVTLDVSARCDARLVARAPIRSLLVVDPLRTDAVLLGFRAAEAAPGETFELSVDSSDLDGDGRDDITLRVSVRASDSKKAATTEFAWFDRAAGKSRDPKKTVAGFQRAVQRLQSLAKNKQNANAVAEEADALRRLYASVCGEGATPRLWTLDNAPLRCNVDALVGSALGAEIEAALVQGRPLTALGLFDRDGWYGAKLPEKERTRLEQSVLAKVKAIEPVLAGSFSADVRPSGAEPRFSPLVFEGERLWVRSSTGRVLLSDPPGSGLKEPNEGGPHGGAAGASARPTVPDPWPLRVIDDRGRTWTSVVPSCDRSELQLFFTARDGSAQPPEILPVLAPRPGVCRGVGAALPIPALPLGFSDGKIDVWVAGYRSPSATKQPPPGSALTSEGTLLVPTRLGLALQRGDTVELWRGERVRGLSDCVPSAKGDVVACVRERSVVVLKRPAS